MTELYYVCRVCGYMDTAGEPPARCEDCGADGEQLTGFRSLLAAEISAEVAIAAGVEEPERD